MFGWRIGNETRLLSFGHSNSTIVSWMIITILNVLVILTFILNRSTIECIESFIKFRRPL